MPIYSEPVAISGALDVTGPARFSSFFRAAGRNRLVGETNVVTDAEIVTTATHTVGVEDSGKVVIATATGSTVVSLPATRLGLTYTLVTGVVPTSGAGNAFSPVAADQIRGNGFTATDDKDAINTRATAVHGDTLTLVGDGSVGWYIINIIGTWGREA